MIETGFSAAEVHAIRIVVTISSSISLLGGFLLLGIFLTGGRIRIFRFRLILYLTFCDILSSLSFILGTYVVSIEEGNDTKTDNILCNVASCFMQFGLIASFEWTTVIGFTLYQICDKDSTTMVE